MGPGRPGWHLECSAMSTKYLGPTFDIHGGGMDLIFPHHENEIAQSRAAGDGFARYWLHNGLVGLAGEKMSKSLGNSLLVTDVLTRVRPAELRYYLGQAHYRSMLEFSEEALDEAVAAYQRIERFVLRAAEMLGSLDPALRPPGTTAGRAARPRSVRPWTTTSPSRRRWPPCTPASGTATRRWPPRTRPAPGPAWPGSGPCWRARPRPARRGRGRRAQAGPASGLRAVVGALVKLALDQRDAARAAGTMRPRTRSGTAWRRSASLVEDTPQGPRWELKR